MKHTSVLLTFWLLACASKPFEDSGVMDAATETATDARSDSAGPRPIETAPTALCPLGDLFVDVELSTSPQRIRACLPFSLFPLRKNFLDQAGPAPIPSGDHCRLENYAATAWGPSMMLAQEGTADGLPRITIYLGIEPERGPNPFVTPSAASFISMLTIQHWPPTYLYRREQPPQANWVSRSPCVFDAYGSGLVGERVAVVLRNACQLQHFDPPTGPTVTLHQLNLHAIVQRGRVYDEHQRIDVIPTPDCR